MKTPKFVAYECSTEIMTNYDIRDKVSKIKVPTLIIVGEKDNKSKEFNKILEEFIK